LLCGFSVPIIGLTSLLQFSDSYYANAGVESAVSFRFCSAMQDWVDQSQYACIRTTVTLSSPCTVRLLTNQMIVSSIVMHSLVLPGDQ